MQRTGGLDSKKLNIAASTHVDLRTVTRNSFQMIACADKYAFDQYRCEPNSTDFGVFYVSIRGGFSGARKCTCDDPASCPSGGSETSSSTPTSNNDHMTSRNYALGGKR